MSSFLKDFLLASRDKFEFLLLRKKILMTCIRNMSLLLFIKCEVNLLNNYVYHSSCALYIYIGTL